MYIRVSRPQPKIEPLRIKDRINSTVRPPSSCTEVLNFLLFSPCSAPLHIIMHEGDVRFELDASFYSVRIFEQIPLLTGSVRRLINSGISSALYSTRYPS